MSRRQVRVSTRYFAFDAAGLRSIRLARGLTQENLAREIRVTLRTVQRWEHGDSAPNDAQLIRLAHALALDADDLYVEEEPAA